MKYIMSWSVTITGADDSVDPMALAVLSRKYPIVEWGILFSGGRTGTPRYPSSAWISELTRTWNLRPDMRLSAHLCGEFARDWMAVGSLPLSVAVRALGPDSVRPFQRVQINGLDPAKVNPHKIDMERGLEVIFQVRGLEAIRPAEELALRMGGEVSLLFDPSGGKGLRPRDWPAQRGMVAMGYAGGITPENVLATLVDLHAVIGYQPGGHPLWVDMGSGVRTDDKFDLEKVESVLRSVTFWNAGLAGKEIP